MEKVSIIMPCYNDGKYIQEAIDSVLAQTYPNIELIIIDDGSDDSETKSILQAISDSRIQLLHSERLRPAGARNLGIAHATGKYILPVDADDRIAPTYVEKAINILDENKNIGVVYCYAELFGEMTGRWELPEYEFRHMLFDNIVFVTAMFRKSDWAEVNGFNDNMKYGLEDYDFWLSILELGKEIYQIPEVLFYYRKKAISRTTEFIENPENMKCTYRTIYDNHKEFFEKYAREHSFILRDVLINHIYVKKELENENMILHEKIENMLETKMKKKINIIKSYLKKYRLIYIPYKKLTSLRQRS